MQAGFWWGVIAALGMAVSLSAVANPDFILAREAYRNGDNRTVAEKAEALSRDPLGIYLRYWLLTRQVETATPEQMLPFLKYYQGGARQERGLASVPSAVCLAVRYPFAGFTLLFLFGTTAGRRQQGAGRSP